MPLFSVDQEKCKRDGLCVAECPVQLIERKDEEAFPTPITGAEEICIHCGHCVAICPHAALSLDTMRPEDCQAIRPELRVNPEQLEHFLKSRRSIRVYKKEPLDHATLNKLIHMTSHAPSGHNAQPVRWLVIETTEDLKPLSELVIQWMSALITQHPELAIPMHLDRVVAAWERGQDRIFRGAPHLIVAYGKTSLPVAQSACIIALTYLELAASSLGLGACWAGYFNAAATLYPPMAEALALPKGYQSYGAMMVGRRKYEYHRIPLRNEPRISWR